eukprot:11207267-Lingulodinium_polyedra.AAC.1
MGFSVPAVTHYSSSRGHSTCSDVPMYRVPVDVFLPMSLGPYCSCRLRCTVHTDAVTGPHKPAYLDRQLYAQGGVRTAT